MFPNLNPKKMQAVMRQMGISQEDIPASRVIIEKPDNSKTIIENPSVAKISMQGQETFQVSGEVHEETSVSSISEISEEDIKTIMEKTQCTEEQAKKALEDTGDLAEAILRLKK